MRTSGRDRGAVRLATMTWLVVVLGVVGIFAFDAVSVMSTRVSAQNDAQNAAYAASSEWHNSNHHNVEAAYQAAVASLAGKKTERVLPRDFTIASDGTVHLLLRATARTIVFGHIGALRHLTVAVESGDANSIS
jgi:hypothetical protein